MPITSKLAEIIAAELKDELYYKDTPGRKGRWYRVDFRANKMRGYEVQLSESQARKTIADALASRYMIKAGFTQADLNQAVKFMQMLLLK